MPADKAQTQLLHNTHGDASERRVDRRVAALVVLIRSPTAICLFSFCRNAVCCTCMLFCFVVRF